MTSAPSPGMRILSPFRSAGVLISRRNHPPICAPVFPAGRGMMLKSEKISLMSSSPPASYSQACCWREVRPNGTQVSKASTGALPV